jgi:hypothetical protein
MPNLRSDGVTATIQGLLIFFIALPIRPARCGWRAQWQVLVDFGRHGCTRRSHGSPA